MFPYAVLPLLLAAASLASAEQYSCPADKCKPPSCVCASTQPPLQPASSVPQFVVLTNDDAATVITVPAILSLTEQFKNRNGCPLPCTWYVSVEWTQAEYIQQVYMKGHEIATHTMHHVGLPNATEIVGARGWLNEVARVPLSKVRGFRGPFLLHDEEQRDILCANGFTYDSTITSTWAPHHFSPDGAHQVWPFTMDFGVPMDCEDGTGPCSLTESHPGLWEFPLYNIQDDNGQVVASMDPAPMEGQPNITELYIRELDRKYASNRAPVGVYLHAARLVGSQEVADQYAAFFRYALSLPDVWVVTVSEVLSWMVNPVPATQYKLSCPTPNDMAFPGGRFCLPPSGGCIQGNWSAATCACTCINQNSMLPGFCPDPATGACTAVKQYNLTAGAFYCPVQLPADDATTPAASSGPATSSAASSSPSTSTGSSGGNSSPSTTSTPSMSASTGGPPEVAATSTPSSNGVAGVQPLGGVQLSFDVQDQMVSFVAKLDVVCAVAAALAGEAAATCTVALVVETAAPASAAVSTAGTRRLASTGYLRVTLAIKPATHSEAEVEQALAAALQDGRLAMALQAVGVQLASGNSVVVLNAAPSSGKGVVGAAVGGAVGGAAALCVAAAVVMVVRRRRAKNGAHHHRLPVGAFNIHDEGAPTAAKHKASPAPKGLNLTAKAGPARAGEAPVSAYASTPRSTATPRHSTMPATFGSCKQGDDSNV